MESNHVFVSFCLLVGLLAMEIIGLVVLGAMRALTAEVVSLMTAIALGIFALLRSPSSKTVTVDNPPDKPVPTEAQ